MATIRKANEVRVSRKENGWAEVILADNDLFGSAAMVAKRWSFEPGARSPVFEHGNLEQLLYVIAGSGIAHVNSAQYRLGDEAVLWMEPGDEYSLEAGDQGLEILLGSAPGE